MPPGPASNVVFFLWYRRSSSERIAWHRCDADAFQSTFQNSAVHNIARPCTAQCTAPLRFRHSWCGKEHLVAWLLISYFCETTDVGNRSVASNCRCFHDPSCRLPVSPHTEPMGLTRSSSHVARVGNSTDLGESQDPAPFGGPLIQGRPAGRWHQGGVRGVGVSHTRAAAVQRKKRWEWCEDD